MEWTLQGIYSKISEMKTKYFQKLNENYQILQQIKEIEDKINFIEQEALSVISGEQGSNGKSLYTNDIARKAELVVRLKEIEEYQQLKTNLIAFKDSAYHLDLDLKKIEWDMRTFSILSNFNFSRN